MDAAHIGKRSRDDDGGGGGGLLPWQNPASRICRVSRASGGKDRHSKVLTSKGLRDRRVRLSVSTAIQFYDLQDRLGYDQPSKAVEWLIRAASPAIEDLPSLDGAFAELSHCLVAPKAAQERRNQHSHGHASVAKSTCSSNSETSKGSVLSLLRSENRTKARERAKLEIEDGDDDGSAQHQGATGAASHCSFTDLLTGNNLVTVAQVDSGFVHRHARAVTADYFGQDGHAQKPVQLPGLAQFANGSVMPFGAPVTVSNHMEMPQQLPFLHDHVVPVTAVAGGDEYNLNFSISSALANFNRGPLQSNSPLMTHFHHLQRVSSQGDGSNLPFFFGAAIPAASAPGENQFPSGIEGRFHTSYGDAHRHSDLKGKGKN